MIHRYVVLEHRPPPGRGEAHVDVMLADDGDGPLRTWRTPAWPLVAGAALVALPPHRRKYLDYEGPLSANRGEVRRVASGTWTLVAEVDGARVVRFDDAQEAWHLGPVAARWPYDSGRDPADG